MGTEVIQSWMFKWFPVNSFIYWNVHLYMRYRSDQWLQIAREITWDQPQKRQGYLSTCAESNPHQAQRVARTNKRTPWWYGVHIPGWYPALWKRTIVLFINLLRSCVWPSRIAPSCICQLFHNTTPSGVTYLVIHFWEQMNAQRLISVFCDCAGSHFFPNYRNRNTTKVISNLCIITQREKLHM